MNTVLEYDKEFDKFVTVENVKGMKFHENIFLVLSVPQRNIPVGVFLKHIGSTIGNSTVEKLRLPQQLKKKKLSSFPKILFRGTTLYGLSLHDKFSYEKQREHIVMELLGTLKIDLPDRGSIDELVLSFGQMDKIIF
uniref:Uncharacterized protein n=1 Tax=Rhizophagus irregularis (strain DAOM 181602 / DAOM 197198 / MUCL 43194) TaxID=747089 RepID=U9SQR2_RHIID